MSPTFASAQSLGGSERSVGRAYREAESHDFTFLRDAKQVRRFVRSGYLVRVRSGRYYELNSVSFPYARPEVALFIERLSNQYWNACGEKLVVTSLTRPLDRQPRNASEFSVHPTGMAVDLRRSGSRACRSWLERVLLSLEKSRVVEATRERYPAHYHVAVFPRQYGTYVERLVARDKARRAESRYTVRSGDSLWTIARSLGTTVVELKATNGLSGSRIYRGQVLTVPGR
ncbi:MAG: DUF5715 family protein [Longimicrobiales bacterium]